MLATARKLRVRRWLELLLPLAVGNVLKRRFYPGPICRGDYATFGDALQNSTGWKNQAIVDATRTSMRVILSGNSSGMDELLHGDQPTIGNTTPSVKLLSPRVARLAAAFLYALADERPEGRTLRILDFGGALGIHYCQLRSFLRGYRSVEWTVCETPLLAEEGRLRFCGTEVWFVGSLSEARSVCAHPDVILASGVLEYTEAPRSVFDELTLFDSKAMVFDSLALWKGRRDRLAVEYVPGGPFRGSYPCWFLSEAAWVTRFNQRHHLEMRWFVPEDESTLDGKHVPAQGVLLLRNSP